MFSATQRLFQKKKLFTRAFDVLPVLVGIAIGIEGGIHDNRNETLFGFGTVATHFLTKIPIVMDVLSWESVPYIFSGGDDAIDRRQLWRAHWNNVFRRFAGIWLLIFILCWGAISLLGDIFIQVFPGYKSYIILIDLVAALPAFLVVSIAIRRTAIYLLPFDKIRMRCRCGHDMCESIDRCPECGQSS